MKKAMTPTSDQTTPAEPMTTQATTSTAITGSPSMASFRDRPSGARALVTVLAVVAFTGLTFVLGYVLDIFIGPDPQGALDVVILGAVVLLLSGLPLLVVLFLPWWRRAVAAQLGHDGRDRAIRILWWSAGACGLGMFYALRNLGSNWRVVIDGEITLVPLLLLILFAFFALNAGAGWAKVLARVVFIVFFVPWLLFNPLGSLVGLGIMFFGLRALRGVQPAVAAMVMAGPSSPLSADGAYWWDGTAWRQVSPDRRLYWDGLTWRAFSG
jgi:hypothetical protein